MKCELVIENALLDEHGELHVTISGYRFFAGEKYTILELGWAVYLAEDDVPSDWMRLHGETRPADAEWNELTSGNDLLVSSHPVLVALNLRRAKWYRNELPVPTSQVSIPTFEEAVEEVRGRKIRNAFNACHAGTVPGLRRWGSENP